METINDTIFGEMAYKHGWYKMQRIKFWGVETELKLVASAYTGQEINDVQRQNYILFMNNLAEISEKTYDAVKKYLEKYHDDVTENLTESYISLDVSKLVKPITVLFKNDGIYGMLCDCLWDEEHGLAIQIKPIIDVGPQDMIL